MKTTMPSREISRLGAWNVIWPNRRFHLKCIRLIFHRNIGGEFLSYNIRYVDYVWNENDSGELFREMCSGLEKWMSLWTWWGVLNLKENLMSQKTVCWTYTHANNFIVYLCCSFSSGFSFHTIQIFFQLLSFIGIDLF